MTSDELDKLQRLALSQLDYALRRRANIGHAAQAVIAATYAVDTRRKYQK